MRRKKQNWYQTFTGRQFRPLAPRAEDICVEDIAHALANTCRFGGHVRFFYSVAQHCVLCSQNVAKDRFQALLHDATEGYLGDVVKPLKNLLPDYVKIEDRLWAVIAKRYRIPVELSPDVLLADVRALATERRDLLNNRMRYHWAHTEGVEPWKERIIPVSPSVAEHLFLERFSVLSKQWNLQLKYGNKEHS